MRADKSFRYLVPIYLDRFRKADWLVVVLAGRCAARADRAS